MRKAETQSGLFLKLVSKLEMDWVVVEERVEAGSTSAPFNKAQAETVAEDIQLAR